MWLPGDKTQHVLWRAKNLFIPLSVKFIVIHCGTNNLDYNDPIDNTKGILNIGKSLLEKAPKSNIILTVILLRDKYKSKRRNKLCEVNSYRNSSFKTEKNMLYMDQGSGWILNSHILNKSLYYKDHLHLIENGNAKFASKISNTIRNVNQLKLNFQLKLCCHSPSTTPQRSISPPQPPPSASSLISPPSTSSAQPPPSISPPHPPSSASVSQPLPSVPPPQLLLTSLPPTLTLHLQLPQSTLSSLSDHHLFHLQNSHYHQPHYHSNHSQPHFVV